MPGQKLAEVDRRKVDPKFICMACGLLLTCPMQTPCGHLLCYVCLQTLLSSPNPTCPQDGTCLKREQVFPDAYTRREVMALCLHCPNPGCNWTGMNKDLENHLKSCDHALETCHHASCNKEIKRCHMARHLKNECDYRNVTCEHCQENLAFVSLKDHISKTCTQAPATCEHCGKKDIPRKDLNKHETEECEEISEECEFKAVGCTYDKVTKRKELRQHFNDELIKHVRLLLKFAMDLSAEVERIMERIRALLGELNTVKEKLTSLVKRMGGLEDRVVNIESRGKGNGTEISEKVRKLHGQLNELGSKHEKVVEKNKKLENDLRERNSLIERLQTRIDRMDEALALNAVKLSDLETSKIFNGKTPSCNGTLLWRIDGFKHKRDEALSGVIPALYSPHFYSSHFGYKMCARIYMNGDGFGKDTHISLFFVVMRGEYDALLTWPFQKKITMMLLDQGTGDHVIDSFRSDPQSSSFQRPKSEMNIASGSPLFMAIENLKSRSYVRDDTMFIKVIVD